MNPSMGSATGMIFNYFNRHLFLVLSPVRPQLDLYKLPHTQIAHSIVLSPLPTLPPALFPIFCLCHLLFHNSHWWRKGTGTDWALRQERIGIGEVTWEQGFGLGSSPSAFAVNHSLKARTEPAPGASAQ